MTVGWREGVRLEWVVSRYGGVSSKYRERDENEMK